MRWCLLYMLAQLSFGDHYSFEEEATEKAKSSGSFVLAPASERLSTFVGRPTARAPTAAPLPPFQGLKPHSHHQDRDVEANATRLVVRKLQEDEKSCSLVLRSLWSEVGRLCNTYFKPAIELQRSADLCARWDRCNSVDRTGVAEKSPTKPTAGQSQQAEEKSVRFQGGEERTERTAEGERQGRGAFGSATTAAHQRTECVCSSMDIDADSSQQRTDAGRIRCGTEAQRGSGTAQQAGPRHFEHRPPSLCPEVGYQDREHHGQAETPGCQRPHQSGKSYGRSHQLKNEFACQLACFHYDLPEHMEGVHLPVPATRAEVPGGDPSCQRSTRQGPRTSSRRLQQQGDQVGGNRDCLRRRGGQEPSSQGVDGQNSGWLTEYDHQSSRAVSDGGTRALGSTKKCQKTTQRRSSGDRDAAGSANRRSTRLCTAFWQAWSIVACGYIDRGAESLCHSAMTLQWNHPVVHQPDFLPSWMASARALDLHLELHPFDFNVPVCLDKALGLPVPRYRSHKKLQVRFADSFEFFSGLESTPTWNRRILPLEVHGQTTSWSTAVDKPEMCEDPLHRIEPPCPHGPPLHAKHVRHDLWCGIRDDLARCEDFCPPNPVSPSFDGHVPLDFGTPPADSIDETPAAAPEDDEDQQQEGQPRRLRDGPDQHQPAWMQPLWNLLQESGHTEMLEEGTVAYLNSHYVSHQSHRRNDSPRPVRIDMDYETWEEGFRFCMGRLGRSRSSHGSLCGSSFTALDDVSRHGRNCHSCPTSTSRSPCLRDYLHSWSATGSPHHRNCAFLRDA